MPPKQPPPPTTTTTTTKLIDNTQPVVAKVGALGPKYWSWVNTPEPVEPLFFANPVLEGCTKTPWWIVPLLWLPVFCGCLGRAAALYTLPPATITAWVCVGIVSWQLLEYLIHRFLFHAAASSYWGITLHFLFHGCHHKYPSDRLRLVFPPVPASAIIALIYTLLHAALPPLHALPLFGGMGVGYVLYDCIHYALHHYRALPGPLLQDLRSHHMDHHYRDPSKGYGISSVLFDFLFFTAAKK